MGRSGQPQCTRALRVACAVILCVSACVEVATVTAESVGGQPGDGVDVLAILPFDNISGAPGDDWIGAGIVETLMADLQGAATVGVIAAVPVDDAAAFEVGQRLGARWLVTGGYQRLGDQLRITARLVDATTGAMVQSTKIDGAIDDLFTLQDRLAAELRRGLPTGGDAVIPSRAAGAPRINAPAPADVEPPAAPSVSATTASGGGGFALAPTIVIDGPPPPVAAETITRDAAGRATVRAIRLTELLRVDGTLDEEMYETVMPLSDFIQHQPDEGAPATERTEAWVFFDQENLYVSVRCWDSAPESQWVVNEMRRDSFNIVQNEHVAILLDTFYDRRNGVILTVNPLGGRMDGQVTDERPDTYNGDWNPIWEVRTGRFEQGWTLEAAIPFTSLRYRPGRAQIWGLNLQRSVRWKNEISALTALEAARGGAAAVFQVSRAATLVGVEAPESGSRVLEVKAYGIADLTSDRNAAPAQSNDPGGDLGIDLKYGVTQNLVADVTVNTDFAQVEADEQQVNLTRFSLFFPEKREFFLENQGLFAFGGAGTGPFGGGGNTPVLFYSRQIGLDQGQEVPIDVGGRLTGRVGAFSLGLLNIQTDDAPEAGAVATNFSVVRLKRDLLRRSSIGAIFTRRSISTRGPGSNETYGVDGTFAFYENLSMNTYWATTRTPGLRDDDVSYRAQLDYAGDRYGVQLEQLVVGENFNPEVGFLRRADFERSFGSVRFSPRPQSIAAIRKLSWEGQIDYITDRDGVLETRQAQGGFGIEFESSDNVDVTFARNYELVTRPFSIAPGVTIPVGGYPFQDVRVSLALGQQRPLSGTLSVQHGSFFSGDKTSVGFSRGRLELTPQVSVEPSVSFNWVDLPEGSFATELVTARTTYTVTPHMFISALLQYNSSNDSLGTNVRLRWEYQPGSELFVVYNDQRDTALRGAPVIENRAFIVKVTRLFRF